MRALTPETIVYGMAYVGDPQLSPDGANVIFTRSQAERTKQMPGSQIWMCTVDGENLRQLTQTGTRNSGGRWAPDGQHIAFVSDRVKKSGLFLMPNGGEARELTRHNGPIGDLAWSPDGAFIAYVALFDPENPDESDPGPEDAPRVRATARVDYKQDSRGYLDNLRPQIWIVDVATGQRRMLTSRPVDHGNPAWSPDGRSIAVKIGNHNGLQSQLGIVDVESSALTIAGPEDGVVGCFAWSPDGRKILIAGDVSQSWQLDWFMLDVASGALARLTDDLHCLPDAGFPTVSPPSQPNWLDNDSAIFHAVEHGASGIYRLNVTDSTIERIARWDAVAGAPSADVARRRIVQAHASLDLASAVVVLDVETGESRTIVEGDHAGAVPASWRTFNVERGDQTIDCWLLTPRDAGDKRVPLVLDIHGGPNSFHGFGFNAIQQSLAGAGIAVLYCNPRGSSSYGREFTQAVLKDWGGEDYLDLMAALDAALANPANNIDPERVGVYGYSYGGFMTSWIIGHTDRFQAAVIGAPVVDLVSFYGTSDIGHIFGPMQIGGTPWDNHAEYVAKSPITYLAGVKTPSLIFHGEADDRCPIGQGEQCFVTLLETGCEVEFVRYPGGAHTFLRTGYPAHREDVMNRLIGWFGQHLGHTTV